MVDSTDFVQVLAEAEDIAQSVSQKLTSAHVLLAMFTVENRAALLLKERGIDEDVLLQAMATSPKEPDGLVRDLRERSREIAKSCGSPEADALHMLIATTRVRCAAQELLTKVGLDLTSLRNTALSYYLSGRMPRKLQLNRAPRATAARSLAATGTQPAPLPQAAVALSVPETSPSAQPQAFLSARDLIDADEAVGMDGLDDASDPFETPPLSPSTIARATTPAAVPPRATPSQPMPVARSAAMPSRMGAASNASKSRALDAKEFPLLTSLGRNLSQAAQSGELDPVVGRAKEIEEVIDILGKRRTNNPCLVGEPGVGKTAVVEGVAQKLLEFQGAMGDRILIELDMATLVAGTQLRGSFSEKLNGLKDEVKKADGRVVVFIDEIHTLIGAGSTGDGPQDAANELKSAMSRGDFPCIGATTHDEFRKYIAQDPALERRFTPVVVNEPSVPETVTILKGVIPRYEEHHGLRFSADALEAAASLAAKYVSDRFLPDKAISIVDLTGSRCAREGKSQVTPQDVGRIVARLAGIPEERLMMGDTERLLRLEDDLKQRVIGHEDAVTKIARVIRRNYAGFASRRPMGSFLFLGPTGVGKTEMARALADVLFGSRDAMVRVDMSELSEAHGVSRLVGAPPGYVGFGEGGQLTEPVRRRPSSVVVLDEIDKAHREVLMLLLQVLEEGRLTDGKGRHIDFSNTVVILTSNLGAEQFERKARPMGFGTAAGEAQVANEMHDGAAQSARKSLPPELWNRIDERLVFRPLQEIEVAKIATLILTESSKRLANEKGIAYVAGDDVIGHLLRSGGFDPLLGARPMRAAVQRLVEAPLAERILAGEFAEGDLVRINVHSGELAFRREHRS